MKKFLKQEKVKEKHMISQPNILLKANNKNFTEASDEAKLIHMGT